MRVFEASFNGHYPVGTAAVIFARDMDHARELLTAAIEDENLAYCNQEPGDLRITELDATEPKAVILLNGDY